MATQNAYGSITVTASGPVIGQAGRGIHATQSATGVGSILVNGSGNVTGTGRGFGGINAQNLNTASNADVTVGQSGNVIGSRDGIRAQTNGNGNITVTTGANATITGTPLYGIEAFSNGQGNITVTTASVDMINSGSVGINVYNQATSIPQATNSFICRHGQWHHPFRHDIHRRWRPPGRNSGGIQGRHVNTSKPTAFGNVTVDNFANINAAGGDGIRAYNFGPGDVTVNDHAGTIVAKDMFGITASSNSTGKVSITTAAGTVINSGSYGVLAINLATAIAVRDRPSVRPLPAISTQATISRPAARRRRHFRRVLRAMQVSRTPMLTARSSSITLPIISHPMPAGVSTPITGATVTSR